MKHISPMKNTKQARKPSVSCYKESETKRNTIRQDRRDKRSQRYSDSLELI